MKNIKNFFVSIFIVIAMPLSSVLAQNTFPSTGSAALGTAEALAAVEATPGVDVSIGGDAYDTAPPQMNFTVTIPAKLQSQIVRVDYENESIFSLKTGNEAPAFLFSVTKVTGDQWMKVKDQIKGYTVIENKDGFITFVQKADIQEINASANTLYREVLGGLDVIVGSETTLIYLK